FGRGLGVSPRFVFTPFLARKGVRGMVEGVFHHPGSAIYNYELNLVVSTSPKRHLSLFTKESIPLFLILGKPLQILQKEYPS
ncbi:MAG: hypothetical protein V1724_10600, partial [Chloroflexota bacterium]